MTQGGLRLDQQFVNFSKFSEKPLTKIDGKSITLSQIDYWFKQAGILGMTVTMTETGLTFSKFKARAITFQDFLIFLEDIASQKDISVDSLKDKLQSCGIPGTKKGIETKKADS